MKVYFILLTDEKRTHSTSKVLLTKILTMLRIILKVPSKNGCPRHLILLPVPLGRGTSRTLDNFGGTGKGHLGGGNGGSCVTEMYKLRKR